jgi:hypothetical protein
MLWIWLIFEIVVDMIFDCRRFAGLSTYTWIMKLKKLLKAFHEKLKQIM